MSLCPDCYTKDQGWLMYKPLRRDKRWGPIKIASGAAYDDTPRGVADNLKRRADDAYDLIRFQRALIAQICQEQHT